MRGSTLLSRVHLVGFAVLAVTVYVIIDREHPRRGTIGVDRNDPVLIELRKSIKSWHDSALRAADKYVDFSRLIRQDLPGMNP